MNKELRASLWSGTIIGGFSYFLFVAAPNLSTLKFSAAIAAFSAGLAYWGMKHG